MSIGAESGKEREHRAHDRRSPSTRWQRLYNPLVILLLRSSLHRIMSNSTMLITYKGRRSGKEYTTPVSYIEEGDDLLAVSPRDHSWWKNLRGGAPVTVRVRGQDLRGLGEAIEDEEGRDGLLSVLRRVPAYRRYWKVELDANGHAMNPEDLARVARGHVPVRIEKFVPLHKGASDES